MTPKAHPALGSALGTSAPEHRGLLSIHHTTITHRLGWCVEATGILESSGQGRRRIEGYAHTMSKQRRSDSRNQNFAGVPFFNTWPERQVQRLLRRSHVSFRTHVRDLPGLPDIVVPGAKLVILVHGCFWHRHSCPNGQRMPKKRRAHWEANFRKRVEKDKAVDRQLRDLGWRVLVVW